MVYCVAVEKKEKALYVLIQHVAENSKMQNNVYK